MSRILFVTPRPFHENSNNAGAKVVNYYAKMFNSSHEVSVLLTHRICDNDVVQMKAEFPNISFITSFEKKRLVRRFIDGFFKSRFLYKILLKFRPSYYRTNNLIKNRLISMLRKINNNDIYDFVIVEFPALILQSDIFQDFFPNAKIVGSVHDISFQSLQRSVDSLHILLSKDYFVNAFKRYELSKLNNFDMLVVLSEKDKQLIKGYLSPKINILAISPYYDTYKYTPNKCDGVFFFGALNRIENRASVIWFLENVWSLLIEPNDFELKFYIIGGGVTKEFRDLCQKYRNVVVTGFIVNPIEYFNKCYAMVVPLQYGAGIKIKSIEALASGIPLISNHIGIEGIPAVNGQHYLQCETPNEWVYSIRHIVNNEALRYYLAEEGRTLVSNSFDLRRSFSNYEMQMHSL